MLQMVPKLPLRNLFLFVSAASADMRLKDKKMVEKVPMTQNGFAKLQEELRWRQQEERPRIIEAISEARSHGDLSENAEYAAAKERQSFIEGRIAELESKLSNAQIINPALVDADGVASSARPSTSKTSRAGRS